MVGRVLRVFKGKEYALILDHTLNYAIHGLPTNPRVWSLLGCEQKQQKLTKKNNGEMVVEVEEKTIQETKVKLVEVQVDSQGLTPEYWNQWFFEKIRTLEYRNYKKNWLYFRLVESKPPFEVWVKAAKYLGHKPGWAYHKHKEHCQ